ncbi:kinase domain protein (macronuclear) [Tetrahymena thermophila SB210]|uniref:Kinase domain protein n=1 Tax=Tetrahymena thermophila (strain SB210) TaxID=312017 RepID=Q229F4_TETTS|nr:kinase domain protein [Tetrahymena thermophila SB210]EAR81919.3 kinase domain protein [Tetrahymena thermophila SB210]|eukprot:XP_001029582.3 kinase domain protein [Tetrahymena thermophila SB210]
MYTNLTRLTLNLQGNLIHDKGAQILGTVLQKCNKIEQLDLNLSENTIGKQGAQALFSSFTYFNNLQDLSLDIQNNKIGNNGAKSLSSALEKLQHLSALTLKLQRNLMSEKGLSSIYSSLTKFEDLISLYIDLEYDPIHKNANNQMSDNGETNLGITLKKQCNKLQKLTLNLKRNLIKYEDLLNLYSGLENCTHLQSLTLNISEKNILKTKLSEIQFSPIFKKLTNLSILNLDLDVDYGTILENLIPLSYNQLQTFSLNIRANFMKFDNVKIFVQTLDSCLNLTSFGLVIAKTNDIAKELKKSEIAYINYKICKYYRLVNKKIEL